MRSHLSLSVRDVPRAVEFYSRLFGVAPQKQTSRYAKFDLTEPALNFSLVEGAEPSRVSHLGIEAASVEEFASLGERLRAAGIASKEERDTSCCYARQDKLWFRDPDGNPWEVFLVHEQLPVSEAAGQGPCGVPIAGAPARPAGGPEARAANAADAAGAQAAGCCGGPAPQGVDACCVKDADAKAAGEAGCGCSAPAAADAAPAPADAALAELSDHLLRDIGITPRQARDEYNKWFWGA